MFAGGLNADRPPLERLPVLFFSNEGDEPPHIHVDQAGSTAKFWLEEIGVARHVGFSNREIAELSAKVRAERAQFLEAWRDHFGH